MNLCQLPTCRIRGRHLPTCGTCPVDCDCHNGPHYPCSVPGGCGSEGCGRAEDCSGCLPRVAEEGLVCDRCADRARSNLAEIVRLTPDARLVAQGLVRRGTGGGSGKPASRPPLNVDAVDALADTHDRLARACITIAVRRGMRFHVPCMNDCVKPTPSQAHCSVCHLTFGGVGGFDRHRRDGQCLTPEAIGYHRDDRGVYREPLTERGRARLARLREPQSDETGSGVPECTPEPMEAK